MVAHKVLVHCDGRLSCTDVILNHLKMRIQNVIGNCTHIVPVLLENVSEFYYCINVKNIKKLLNKYSGNEEQKDYLDALSYVNQKRQGRKIP